MSKPNPSPRDSDPAPLWERQPWDTAGSWLGFTLYLAQQPPRSIDAAYRAYRKQRGGDAVASDLRAAGYFRRWAQGRKLGGEYLPGAVPWELRAQAWDDHLAELDRREEARQWLERRRQLREDEWALGTQLVDRARKMLQFPLTVVEASEDGKTTVVMPARWASSDIPRTIEAASKLRRLAAAMATEQVAVTDWREEARAQGIEDPDALLQRVVQELVAAQLNNTEDGDGDN
jgi:hypothetical protein